MRRQDKPERMYAQAGLDAKAIMAQAFAALGGIKAFKARV